MILKSLHLKNYRTYRGPEEINFATGDKNITIIQGNNEVGKTTIMNAITWCLYGKESYKNEGNEPIWNKNASYDLECGNDDIVEVILIMEDSKGKEVKFIRNLTFYKNDNGECKQETVDDDILIDGLPVTYKSTYISKHLPEAIKEYFLFDGEQLETYFKDDTKNIEKSINKLSQLNILERTIKHLDSREDDYNNKLRELNPSLGRTKIQIKSTEESLNNKEEELNDIISNIKKWEKQIKEDEKSIREFGDNPKRLIDKKDDLRKKLKDKDKDITRAVDEYNKFLFDNLPKIMSFNTLLKVKNIGKDLEQKGYIPSRFKKEFLDYLLKEHECICGADLSKGTPGYIKLKKLYEQTSETTNIADDVNILLGSVNNIIDNFPIYFNEDLINKKEDIDKLNREREGIDKEITNIENILSDDAEKDINKLQNRIDTYNKYIKMNYQYKGSYQKEIENLKKNLEDLNKDLKKQEFKNEQKSDLERSIDFCNKSRKFVEQIHDELKQEIHHSLNELTSEEFDKMHWKEFYHGVSIDEKYNVTIHKENGDVVPNDLSKGGQLVLALSFMTALNSLSGFELPIIIDTPLGRLDEPIKENIGKYLPIYTKNKQVTLLVTSSEYTPAFKKGIRDYVGEQYLLNFIEEGDGMTTIESKKMEE